ncbi:hypothetical protein BaRGS_00035950 [Batillaria attramentaria]|uniref:Uncharacterized protein n=1 Tax=Batillaria attramentaria TaxID=370345 RepID=A0ABD0JD98_9CAEN
MRGFIFLMFVALVKTQVDFEAGDWYGGVGSMLGGSLFEGRGSLLGGGGLSSFGRGGGGSFFGFPGFSQSNDWDDGFGSSSQFSNPTRNVFRSCCNDFCFDPYTRTYVCCCTD